MEYNLQEIFKISYFFNFTKNFNIRLDINANLLT